MTHKPSLKLFIAGNTKHPEIGGLCRALYTDQILKVTQKHPSHDAILTRAKQLSRKEKYRSILPVFMKIYNQLA
jgi:hypothetical protein